MLWKGLQVSVGEANHPWGSVIFVGFDYVEVVIIGG